VDVIDYDIFVDLSAGKPFHGEAVVTMKLLRPCANISLQLAGTADSVEVGNTRLSSPTLGALPTTGIAVGQPFSVHVWYHCNGYVESGGWGGMHFDADMNYNLGVGFDADPHVMGRAFFPCRDNFTDKATYTLRVKAKVGWTAECGGMLQSRILNADSTESTVWRIEQQTPTYLVSVSQAAWKRIYDSIPSLYGTYPATYGYLRPDSATVSRVFAELDSVVPMYERCFGPYRWGRIGYIATNKGSMEHVNNIGLAKQALTTAEAGQTTIAHELGHAWFGNLVTCETEGDMWINEGGASFTSEVAMQSVQGREASDDYYQRHLEKVLRTTHVTDAGYRPLSPMPHDYTYGSTTYDKGWMVWHSLRGYLGEEVFYSAIQRLMNSCAFGNIDSYRLRDSLSLYTGVDLTDFFDFHVFSPGFVDYHVDLIPGDHPAVDIRQQTVGTTATSRGSLVPVTFFGTDGTTTKGYFQEGTSTLDVQYDVAFCVLDRDCEFSDAATLGVLELFDYVGLQTLPIEHLKIKKDRTIQTQKVYAEHHFAPAMGEMPEGVVRRANRYWMLRGAWNETDSLKGYFHFVRGAYNNSYYPNLDRGFYTKAATADSLGLFYRANGNDSWHLVSRHREGDANEGWLVAENILPGEYTLAVVDFEHLSIPSHLSPLTYNLFPNPLSQGQPLTIEVDTEMPFAVTIVDIDGRTVWHRSGCLNGQSLNPQLPAGTYIVTIENKQISLKSKLIQL
jgi:aminopeptidase N